VNDPALQLIFRWPEPGQYEFILNAQEVQLLVWLPQLQRLRENGAKVGASWDVLFNSEISSLADPGKSLVFLMEDSPYCGILVGKVLDMLDPLFFFPLFCW